MDLLLGVDIGSTSVKAIVYETNGNPVAQGICKLVPSYTDSHHPMWCVWKHKDVWNSVTTVLREVTSKSDVAKNIKALAVTGFGMDGLPIDKDGKELYDLISWHCPRTIEQFEERARILSDKEMFIRAGKTPMTIDSIYRIMWMSKYHPEIMEKTATWLLIEDYVNYKLCGEKATDYSMASTVSAFNHETHTWCIDILTKLNINGTILPKPMQSGTVLGKVLPKVAKDTGLSTDTLVVLGGHDYICAALATGVIDEKSLMDVAGTWEMLIKGSARVDKTWNENSRYYYEGHVAKNAYCQISSVVSGSMMEWMKVHLSQNESWQNIMAKAKNIPIGSFGCIMLPHFSGSNAPVIEPTSLGAYVGLSNKVSNAGMIRATFEGLTFKTKELLQALDVSQNVKSTEMKVVGGTIKNTLLMQMKADILGITVEAPNIYEATSLGAALVAGIGANVFKNEAEAIASVYKEGQIYEPNQKAHEQYNDIYNNIFLRLQGALCATNKEIFNRFIK